MNYYPQGYKKTPEEMSPAVRTRLIKELKVKKGFTFEQLGDYLGYTSSSLKTLITEERVGAKMVNTALLKLRIEELTTLTNNR